MSSITVINPTTGNPLQSYPTLSPTQLATAIDQTAQVQREWQLVPLAQRRTLMKKAAEILRLEVAHYATIITEEMGKPILQARKEIEKCSLLCDYYADQAETYLQPEIIHTERQKSYRCFQPLGLIFAIMPWNFPFWQVLRFAVPNLMGGNGCLLKHAPNSLGAGTAIEQLFKQAGFPEQLFCHLIIDVDLAANVIAHPAVHGVTLTGSERAGSAVAEVAGHHLKKVVMELGGSDPYLILADADLDLAVEQCLQSRLANCGQVCIAAKRIIVVEQIYDEFIAKILARMAAYQMGDPLQENTLLGPMARADLRTTLHQQVQNSIAAGAKCLLGGTLPSGSGYYYPATLLVDVKPGNPALTEELFGPVVTVIAVRDEAAAITLANDTRYGLGAAVFTRDEARGEAIAREQLQAGTCTVNIAVNSDPRLPFGGIKFSGFGRELAAEGMREFMNIKTVVIA